MRTIILVVTGISILTLACHAADERVSNQELLDKSREQYISGDYASAIVGLEEVISRDPESVVAAYYLEKMREIEQRDAEEGKMDAVSEMWAGMLLRDYPVSATVRRMLNLEDVEKPVDIQKGFPEVVFGPGTYALYRPKLSRIFVLNKVGEVQKLETILSSLDSLESSGEGQVEIESRFVEFSEGALEELGFSWSDVVDGTSVSSPGDWSVVDGENLFANALRSVPFSQTGALGLGEIQAIGPGTVGRIEDSFGGAAGAVRFSGKINSADVDLLVRALDQTSGIDVLSAPRVVTVSGKEAVIKVGQRHYYPEVYESGASMGTVLHVLYEDFYEKLLGVELKVTPTIKGDEIGLSLNPKITDLIGWDQFELAPADTSYSYYQYRVGQQFEHDPVIARLPVFKERELQTEVTVQDGATIGMGGLISNKLEAFEDRVPVLGSLPLVGRFFRSEGERSIKRNLMIFVTAKKVQSNGAVVAERTFK